MSRRQQFQIKKKIQDAKADKKAKAKQVKTDSDKKKQKARESAKPHVKKTKHCSVLGPQECVANGESNGAF